MQRTRGKTVSRPADIRKKRNDFRSIEGGRAIMGNWTEKPVRSPGDGSRQETGRRSNPQKWARKQRQKRGCPTKNSTEKERVPTRKRPEITDKAGPREAVL